MEKSKHHDNTRIEHATVKEIRRDEYKIVIVVTQMVKIDTTTNEPVKYPYQRNPSITIKHIGPDGKLMVHGRPEPVRDENGKLISLKFVPTEVLSKMMDEALEFVMAMRLEDDEKVAAHRKAREERQQRMNNGFGHDRPMRKTGKTERKRNKLKGGNASTSA